MTPNGLGKYLSELVRHRIRHSVMIWGPPGIGKSSVVKQLAASAGLEFIDLRLSQLAPTDLRGLPVPRDGVTEWYTPEFLPRQGEGILFLDEINLAPPVLQGVAQQLVLDRRVGAYEVPDGWFVWAAGNRKEDRGATYDMPAPLANRFLHLHVEPHLESFRRYAIDREFHELIIGFLNFRPALLHKADASGGAWPSPRSWEMANALFKVGLDVTPAIGAAAASEFRVFEKTASQLPEIDVILRGKSKARFPTEPSVQYALTIGLVIRASTLPQALHGFRWLARNAPPEWVQVAAADLFPKLRAASTFEAFKKQVLEDDELVQFIDNVAVLLG